MHTRRTFLQAAGAPLTKHPRTGETVHAHALGTTMPAESPGGDRRLVLADWLTRADNPWFARNLANRLWAHFMGRGLVEPVDDVRATNPPSHPELLDALAKHLSDQTFDAKALIRFRVSGEEAGDYCVRIDAGRCETFEGAPDAADLVVTTPSDVWVRIVRGELDGAQALMEQQYSVEGDYVLLARFPLWFRAPV